MALLMILSTVTALMTLGTIDGSDAFPTRHMPEHQLGPIVVHDAPSVPHQILTSAARCTGGRVAAREASSRALPTRAQCSFGQRQ
jgi:hypothetical protein